jgi:hypothetical protein
VVGAASVIGAASGEGLSGFPRPMVNPLVPSGMRGPGGGFGTAAGCSDGGVPIGWWPSRLWP